MSQINVWMGGLVVKAELLSQLTQFASTVNWTDVDSVLDADIIFVSPEDGRPQHEPEGTPVVTLQPEANVEAVLNGLIGKGLLILPTELGMQALIARLDSEQHKMEKLRRNNPLHLKDSQKSPAAIVDSTVKMAAWALHPNLIEDTLPDLKKVMDGRDIRQLQRSVPFYVALLPRDPSLDDVYPDIPLNVQEHLRRIELAEPKMRALKMFEDLHMSIPKTDMSLRQINLGIPMAGGEHRRAQGLISPTPLFKECAEHVASVMLDGASDAYNDDPEAFEESNVRVGVKKDNFQGTPLCTKSHAVRQTYWKIAENHEDGLFCFSKYNFPTIAGYRCSANSGKKRMSFTLDAPGSVSKARVLDSDDLKEKVLPRYIRDILHPQEFVDNGKEGARGRIVDNVWVAWNDATTPIPAYIAAFKNYHYKAIYNQDLATFHRFIPTTTEFVEFWTEGYNDNQWVRDFAKARGCNTLEDLIVKMVELGEFIICGDVENFDGNASWEITCEVFKHLMSTKALAAVEQIWNSDKIGSYIAADGTPVYYYVACTEDPTKSAEFNELARKTRTAMSHVPSGMGPTSQAGRGVVPACLLEIIITLYPETKPFLLSLPPKRNSHFSAMSALMNSAGDDHSMGSLIIWLITGKHPKDVMQEVLDFLPSYKVMKILPEYPKMNAGFLFHESDKDGRLTHVSLSPGRCFTNTVFPERARSAVGLHAALGKFQESTIGTPIYDEMSDLIQIIAHDIFGFDCYEHLGMVANAEQAWMDANSDDVPALERLALLLDVTANDLEWKYTMDDLIEMGAPAFLVNEFRRPIPAVLTKGPFNFLNADTIKKIAIAKRTNKL